MEIFWLVFLAFMLLVFVWVAVMSGVIVGGLLVFRTKREAHEPFMSMKEPAGGAINLVDEFENVEPTDLPDVIEKMNEQFKKQMGEGRS